MINIKNLTKLFVAAGFVLALTNTSVSLAQSNETAGIVGLLYEWDSEIITPKEGEKFDTNRISTTIRAKQKSNGVVNPEGFQIRMMVSIANGKYFSTPSSESHVVAVSEWVNANQTETHEFTFKDIPLLYDNENYIACAIEYKTSKSTFVGGSLCKNGNEFIETLVHNKNNQNIRPVFRYWSDLYQSHFFVANLEEKKAVDLNNEWEFEGVAYYAGWYQTNFEDCYIDGQELVSRFWSDRYDAHFFSINKAEVDYLKLNQQGTWRYEGPAFCAYPSKVENTSAVHRFWSKTYLNHFYTNSDEEKDIVINSYSDDVWKYENVDFYVTK